MRTFFATLRSERRLRWLPSRPPAASLDRATATIRASLSTAGATAQTETGMTLLEVVVASLLVALIAGGTFTGFEAASLAGSQQRASAQATKLVQQDEERLRGLTMTKLAELAKSGSEEKVIEVPSKCGELSTKEQSNKGCVKYTITSTASFVSGSQDTLSCETKSSAANYIKTTSSARWTGLGSNRPAVSQSSIISTLVTGLLVKVRNQHEEPVAGATISVTGATSQVTSASGCALFLGLSPGTVTVGASDPPLVDHSGKTPAKSETATIVSEKVETTEFQIAKPGAIEATFQNGGTNVTGTTFVAFQGGIPNPEFFVGGTVTGVIASTYANKVSLPTTLFPFSKLNGTLWESSPYTVYAGACPANAPAKVTASGEKLTAKEALVLENGTAAATGVEAPPITGIVVWEGTKTTPKSHFATAKIKSADIYNTECEKKTAQNYATEVPYKNAVALNSSGEIEVADRYQPYAKELQFCVVVEPAAKKWDKYLSPAPGFENKVKAGSAAPAVYLGEPTSAATGYTHESTTEQTC